MFVQFRHVHSRISLDFVCKLGKLWIPQLLFRQIGSDVPLHPFCLCGIFIRLGDILNDS